MTVPYEVTKVAISGPLTQVYAIPLVGELMVGVSNYIAEDIALYLPEYISTLPELGQLYGGKGEMDLEALLAAGPDVVIDVGDTKDGIAEDMDSLTEQTGIPFVHIDATVETAPEAYRMLGELTGQTEKAEELATWCEETYAMTRWLRTRPGSSFPPSAAGTTTRRPTAPTAGSPALRLCRGISACSGWARCSTPTTASMTSRPR